MRRIDQDIFARRSTGTPLQRRPGFVALSLILVSIALLILSRVDNSTVRQARWSLVQLLSPLLSAAATPLEPVRWTIRQLTERRNLLEENARLAHENERLTGWEGRAREFERRIASLSTLARVVEESAIPFATARVIAEAGGPFVRSVIVEAGRTQGIKPNQPVIGAHGLIGRIIEAGPQAARVLLVTDRASRIPVLVGGREERAILTGDNEPEPRLVFATPGGEIGVGDEVSTSGVGGMFPRGLRIGRVVMEPNGSMRVEPHVRLDRLDYVSVLLTSVHAVDVADETSPPPAETRVRRAQARQSGDSR